MNRNTQKMKISDLRMS